MFPMEGSTMNKIFFRKRWLVIGISLFLILGASPPVQASEITDELKTVIDEVIDVVLDPKYKDDQKTRRDKMKGLIFPKFNFLEMGKRSLGAKNWKARSPEEKKTFVDIFGKLLESSYANKLESFSDEKIKYVDEIVKGKFAMVKTQVVRKNDSVSIDYKMIKTGDQWLIFDIVIEGVSAIKNYRSQFAKVIHDDSFDTLMEKLNAKIIKLQNGQNSEDENHI